MGWLRIEKRRRVLRSAVLYSKVKISASMVNPSSILGTQLLLFGGVMKSAVERSKVR